MKIPLISGRDFRPEDTSPGAAIVNETFAKTFFPGQDPIGRTFERGANQPLNKIVGVTPDVPDHDLREPNGAVFYVPFNVVDDKSAPKARRTSPPSSFTPKPRTRSPSPTPFAGSSPSATTAFASRTSPRSSNWSATRPFASA